MLSQSRLSFFLNKNKINAVGKAPIYLRIRYQNEEVKISTGVFVVPEKWNQKTQQMKGSDPESDSLYDQIIAIEVAVRLIISRAQSEGDNISVQEIKHRLFQKSTPKETIVSGFETYCVRMDSLIGKDFCKATVARYRHTKGRVAEFIKENRKGNDVLLSKVDDGFMEDFESFLKTTYKNDHTTIYKHYQRITKVLRYYLKRHAIEKFPLIEYQIRPNKKKVEYLDTEEIRLIETKKIEIIRLDVIRDLYVFSIYSGFAYTEMYNLSDHHLITGMDNNPWISMNRQKTDKPYQIPLLPKALAIIKKYEKQMKGTGKLLPVPSNQKFNAYLKEIATICGIKKHLTVHLARKTFAISILLKNNISIPVVSSLLGHQDIKVTLDAYSSVMPEMVIREFASLKGKLNSPPGKKK